MRYEVGHSSQISTITENQRWRSTLRLNISKTTEARGAKFGTHEVLVEYYRY